MAEISSLYPAPPRQPESLLNQNPLQLYGNVLQVQRSAQDLAARNAIGDIYRQNIQGGQLNEAGVINALKGSPAAGFLAPDVVGGALTRQGQRLSNTGQQISNTTALFNQNVAQSQFVASKLAGLADKDNISDEDLHNFVVQAARNTNVPASILNGWMRSLPKDSAGRKAAIAQIATSMMSPEGAAAPAVTGYGESGAPISGTAGQASLVRRAPGAPPGPPGITGLPPGYETAATAIGGASGGQAVALTAANDTSMTRKGMLGNLEEDLNHFTSGPSADWTKVAKAWVNRNVPLPAGWQFDPKSIASQESFHKQAEMLAQQQFATIGGTGTDAKFSSAFASNPNETLSQLGNRGIIRMLKGNEDAIQAKNRAWQSWLRAGHGPQTYPQFSAAFNEKFDPRTFQFKYMPQKERQEYIERMDPVDQSRFIAALTYAHDQGWIGFEGKK